MPFNNVFAENLEDYTGDLTQMDINYLNTLPRIKRGEIPFIILKNTAYQLVLDKYLQLFELCWKYGDDKGNNERFAQCLNYHNGLQLHEIDAVAERLVFLPLENPTDDVAKEFFKRVFAGELEFACRMHILNGYSAYDLARGYYYHYEEGKELLFERAKEKSLIFLPESL